MKGYVKEVRTELKVIIGTPKFLYKFVGERPTMLFDVHAHKWEDHVAILSNEKNQPIGPTDDDMSEFSKFLGTMAHDHTWTLLTYTNWTKVPHKEKNVGIRKLYSSSKCRKIGDAINSRLLESLQMSNKERSYYKYDNDADRWKHHPNREPDPTTICR
ncbi:hypothetical protein Cgig2_020112 [Carnegiea gigantea]|uniref:Uncharacterized protein n=1 Tax=Carnegiea gigantea TaxID=171969 RepID=A0A9Q1KEW0_9CARY|nr:hypothetical protein Cgig2_020112 [Carnegiea gigantea]